MENNDVELIQQILAGDENAFAELVTKYQKPVHALAWRKVGDFHIAEEITQDAFLKVYQRLHTLKDANQFSGWLYVIATRRCYAWLRKKRIRTQPLEDAETTMGQRDAYSRHVVEERAKTGVESQREVVKKLLAKLKESERTVMTLHYLGEMTVEEISKFLGVSAGTIKSRLQRARNRLQKEETMIREALEHFQISPNLTDNIMREIPRLKLTPSPSKPFVPWIIGASSAVLIVLMLGIGSQYLARFQQPYNLDAQSERAIELINAPIVQNVDTKPDVRNQLGARSDTDGPNNGNGEKSNQVLGREGDYTQWNLPKDAKARLGKGRANDIAYSPDGRRLAVASSIGIWLYDTDSGKELDLLTGHTAKVLSVAFNLNGNILASGSDDGSIHLWDTRTSKHLRTMTGDTSLITNVVFSEDGKMLASSSKDNTIRLWDTQTGEIRKTLKGHADNIFSIWLSWDGKMLASASKDNTIRLWDTQTGEIRKTLDLEHSEEIYKMAFSADGKTLASWCFENPIYLWNAQIGELRHTLPLEQMDIVNDFAFSPDGKTLASAMHNGIVHLWNVQTGERLQSLVGHTHWALNVVFSPDGKTLASGSFDSTIRFWDVQTGKPQKTLTGHLSDTVYVAFSHDGKTLANAMEDDTIRLWDVQTGEVRQILKRQPMPSIAGVAFSPDGKTLAGGGGTDGGDPFTIRLWDVQTGVVRKTFGGHKNYVTSVAFSVGGTLLASASWDKTIQLYHAQTGELLKTFSGHTDRVMSVAFSPNRKMIASGSEDNTVRIWDVQTGEILKTLIGYAGAVFSVAFNPDGKTLASGSHDGLIHLWDVQTGEILETTEHTDWVMSVAFSPDGRTLASGSKDSTVHLWDTQTNIVQQISVGHTSWVTSVAFSPDGKTLASGSRDGTLLLWEITSDADKLK